MDVNTLSITKCLKEKERNELNKIESAQIFDFPCTMLGDCVKFTTKHFQIYILIVTTASNGLVNERNLESFTKQFDSICILPIAPRPNNIFICFLLSP